MKKVIFACDLDNTLIHSYRTRKEGDICIEWIHGKEQGYMDSWIFQQLPQLGSQVMVVPVTTRSVEQYRRIQWNPSWRPRYAVTTNGAILLEENEPDDEWAAQSMKTAALYKNEMNHILEQLEEEDDYIRCRLVDDRYLFSYCKEGVDVRQKAARYGAGTKLAISVSGKKMYFFPPQMNKGEAVRLLQKRFSPDYVIAAGDSSIDIPMLEEADAAICKYSIYSEVSNENKFGSQKQEDFSRFVIDSVYRLISEDVC